MHIVLILVIICFAAILSALFARIRVLTKQAAIAQLEAARLQRHTERLELVLKQLDPEKFAHVKARSDMEWQQAVKGLKDGELPVLFPLETSYAPITPASGQAPHTDTDQPAGL